MLRVIASRNAKEYFKQSLKREDYYTEGQEISGDWQGSIALSSVAMRSVFWKNTPTCQPPN
jgi:hypothetical protein